MGRENEFIMFDWAMKHMLRDKSNFEILEGLISVLLGQDIKIKEILESESNQEDDSDKFNRVDIKAVNSQDQIIIVEIQLTRQYHFIQRILYGISKTITEHIKLVEKYDKVKKVYSISLLYCDYGIGDDYIYHAAMDFQGMNTGTPLIVYTKESDSVVRKLAREIFPECYLLRVKEFDKLPTTPMDEWMTYLKTGVVKENTRTPGLQQVREKLKVLNMTQAEKDAYFRHLDNVMVQNDVFDTARTEGREEGLAAGLAEGRAEGRAEGIEIGEANERANAIRNMLSFGITAERIAEKYGMTTEEVLAINVSK